MFMVWKCERVVSNLNTERHYLSNKSGAKMALWKDDSIKGGSKPFSEATTGACVWK